MRNIDEVMNSIRALIEEQVSEPEAKKAREFWVRATGSQNSDYRDRADIDISKPLEDRWIYTLIQTVNPKGNRIFEMLPWVHVREILPGEIPVTREMLAKEWDKHIRPISYGQIARAQISPSFREFCQALGFKDPV